MHQDIKVPNALLLDIINFYCFITSAIKTYNHTKSSNVKQIQHIHVDYSYKTFSLQNFQD